MRVSIFTVKNTINIVLINVINESIKGKSGFVSFMPIFEVNAAGIFITVETTKTINTMSILAINPDISAQRELRAISWNVIFLGQNDIFYMIMEYISSNKRQVIRLIDLYNYQLS
jgi:hypothetical protein